MDIGRFKDITIFVLVIIIQNEISGIKICMEKNL